MTRFAICAALALLTAAPAAQAATYMGDFTAYGGYISGRFTGEDRDGDARIGQDELTGFSARVNNANGGPGQYAAEATGVSGFLFQDIGSGFGMLSGTISYVIAEPTCGGWDTPPCWDGGGMMMRAFAFAVSEPLMLFTPRSETFSTDQVIFSVMDAAPVPLPAGLPLMAAGMGALVALRRRRRT